MSLTFKAKGGGSGDFKTAPAGNHIAVCNLIADLGLQPGSGMYPDPKHQVYLRFELPAERIDYTDKDGNKKSGPIVVGWTFTASMHEKANLRKQLEAWRGKKFSDDEAENFDVTTILGKACLLNLVEKPKGDKVYVNPASLSPLPRGTSSPKTENKLLYYGEDNKSAFSDLPNWLQEKIKGQLKPQYEHATGVYKEAQESGEYDFGAVQDDRLSPDSTYITDEDIPF